MTAGAGVPPWARPVLEKLQMAARMTASRVIGSDVRAEGWLEVSVAITAALAAASGPDAGTGEREYCINPGWLRCPCPNNRGVVQPDRDELAKDWVAQCMWCNVMVTGSTLEEVRSAWNTSVRERRRQMEGEPAPASGAAPEERDGAGRREGQGDAGGVVGMATLHRTRPSGVNHGCELVSFEFAAGIEIAHGERIRVDLVRRRGKGQGNV